MARKRKATKQGSRDPYDSDEIQVASLTPTRSVLQNVPVQAAQNKRPRRQRSLDHVLIPVSREAQKLITDFQAVQPGSSRASLSTLSRTPGDRDGNSSQEEVSSRRAHASRQQTEISPASAEGKATTVHAPPPAHTTQGVNVGRPKRSTQRVSYIQSIDLSDDSADELSGPATAPARRRAYSTKAASVSSDYEEEDEHNAAETEDDSATDDSGIVESEPPPEDEPEDEPVPRKAKRSSAKAPAESPDPASAEDKPSKKLSKQMKNLTSVSKGLDLSLPPLHNIDEMFADLTVRALPIGLEKAARSFGKRRVRVATMCSGTESPLLAIDMIRDALKSTLGCAFDIEHVFSAEIVPFKQAYIERNFAPPIIFQDIRELVRVVDDEIPMAKTAFGGTARVPTDIDIVIAGTSCVDYSRLNKHGKGHNEQGESHDTWQAVLNFCKAYRPALAILENVKTAYWDHMLQDYKVAGYEPAGAYVDSKNYYVPQTRHRGYMAAFDKARLDKAAVSSAGETWKTVMEKLQRRASSPASSFLLSNDQIAGRPLQVNENGGIVDWKRCEITQMDYRRKKRLGVARPMTNWSESGSMLPPDHGSRPWHGAQVERVNDTLDVATLRKASEGYDARYKLRVWDLSQNAHRLKDTNHFGIIGCITPTGSNFISDSWRAMTPEECLALQGIPLNKISFTVETSAQVQDLAGNAMSCPLIGAAFLSGLIAGHEVFEPEIGTEFQQDREGQVGKTVPELVEGDQQSLPLAAGIEDVDFQLLLEDSARSARRCYCEGARGITNRTIQKCVDCGHTTCVACGGNPAHQYWPSQYLTNTRTPFSTFEEELRSQLPLLLRLQNVPEWSAKAKPTDYHERLRPITKATFAFSGIQRSHTIRVLYRAPRLRLELHLLAGKATWYLYADPPDYLAMNAPLREVLLPPVAQSEADHSLLAGSWQWRDPKESTSAVKITGRGLILPEWRARMQMPDHVNHAQWEYLDVDAANCAQDLSGTYRHLPNCGTARASLYKRVDPRKCRPVYLFQDPTTIGPVDKDCFVFAHDHSRLDRGETRHVLARLDASWGPWTIKDAKKQKEEWTTNLYHYRWSSSQYRSRLSPVSSGMNLLKPSNLALTTEPLSCHQKMAIMSARFDHQTITRPCRTTDGFVSLDNQRFFSETAWIFEAMRRQLSTNEWIEVPTSASATTCDCAPDKPALRWAISDEGLLDPYEDPRMASTYERAIKSRQSPVLVHTDDKLLQLGINFGTLAHRVRARLPSTGQEVTLAWRLSTSAPRTPSSKIFRLLSTRGLQPHDENVHMSVTLHPNQCMSLAWMKEQESGTGKQVMVEETEEASLPHLGWRIEMRAQTSTYVKGGICADHPGFGKTITSLALIHGEWLEHGAKGLQEMLLRTSAAKGPASHSRISSATVVICPKVLVPQWREEAREKWRSADHICVIRDAADLTKYSIERFASAKLIIVSRQALSSDVYTERLAAFAAMPGPVANKGRPYTEWYKHATKQIPDHLEQLEKMGRKDFVTELKRKYHDKINDKEFVRHVPSKRLKGKAYVEDALSRANAASQPKATKPASPELQTHLIGPPLLEMFQFNRVIVDEFHSADAKELEIIAALKAEKRWGLSGTPQHGDSHDVAQIGRLLGVSLRIGSIQRGVIKAANIRALHSQMTPFEKFEAARVAPTGSQNVRIQELAQQFLDTFVRRNVMDITLSLRQHLIPTSLSLVHYAFYHELSQQLNSSEMKIRKSTKQRKTVRDQQFADAVDSSNTAEEALSKSAAYPRSTAGGSLSPKPTVDDWLQRRELDMQDLLEELQAQLRRAYVLEAGEYFNWKAASVDGNQIGDKEVYATVRDMCKQVEAEAAEGCLVEVNENSKSKRLFISEGNKLVNRLLTSWRSIRYLQNVKRLQSLGVANAGSPKTCNHLECHSMLSPKSKVAVSGFCGHLICADCYDHLHERKETKCPATGCHAGMASHLMLWNKKLRNVRGARHTQHGAKIDAALDILESVRKKGQQAVLFVQYENQLLEVEHACKDRGIRTIVVHGFKAAGKQIDDFRDNPRNTAIVLNASSEASEGLNLQFANHVIFLSPLLRDSQYLYDSNMAQAIGRVARHGQEKEIHVYRILALNTIDVDILEHRERRTDALVEEGEEVIPPPATQMLSVRGPNGEVEAERTQLVVEEGKFSLRPQSWLTRCGGGEGEDAAGRVKGKHRVGGWEDFSSLVKFSRTFTEDED